MENINLFKRPDTGYWLVSYFKEGTRYRASHKTKNQKEALKRLTEFQRHSSNKFSSLLLSQFINKYKDWSTTNKAPKTTELMLFAITSFPQSTGGTHEGTLLRHVPEVGSVQVRRGILGIVPMPFF